MAIHNWTKVDAGLFHDFHLSWLDSLKRALNRDIPPDYYVLAEQWASELGPDVLALRAIDDSPTPRIEPRRDEGGIAVAEHPPKTLIHINASESEFYVRMRRRLVVRHVSGDEIIAVIEIMSPGNKSSTAGITAFVQKVRDLIGSNVHVLVVDLFPPTPRDPNGIHNLIWDGNEPVQYPPGKRLTCVSYMSGNAPEAYLQPVAIGDELPDMPLFLTPARYISVPLGETYNSAFDGIPRQVRRRLGVVEA